MLCAARQEKPFRALYGLEVVTLVANALGIVRMVEGQFHQAFSTACWGDGVNKDWREAAQAVVKFVTDEFNCVPPVDAKRESIGAGYVRFAVDAWHVTYRRVCHVLRSCCRNLGVSSHQR